MQTLQLSGTDIRSSRLGFGLSGLHHLYRRAARQRLLGEVYERGIRHFDVAPYYGHGLAETELGRFAAGRREQLVLATKFGIEPSPVFAASPSLLRARLTAHALAKRVVGYDGLVIVPRRDYTAAAAAASLERSLRALRTEYVDVLFLHEPTLAHLPDPESLLLTLERLKHQGKFRHFGLAGRAGDCVRAAQRLQPVATVLQVDAAPGVEELVRLNEGGIKFHSSFGHFRGKHGTMKILLEAAVAANRDGVVLFSTRRLERVRAMVELLGELEPA